MRRSDLLPDAVRAATGRRLAGDWQGACGAAGIEVDQWLVRAVRSAAVAGSPMGVRLRDDLRHLAPELIRWYLFAENPMGPARLLRTGRSVGPDGRIDMTRYDDRIVLADYDRPGVAPRWDHKALLLTARNRAYGPPRLRLCLGDPVGHRWDTARFRWDARQADRVPPDGPDAWFTWPLRSGRLPPSAVPPLVRPALVRAALFPAGVDEPYEPAPGVEVPAAVHVQCGSARHFVGWRAGRLTALSHTPDDLRREGLLADLGGPVSGCLATLRSWQRRSGPLPRQLRVVARQLFVAACHGDTAEVTRLLDAGVDPLGVRGPQGQTLLHVAGWLGDRELIRRLLRAGLDPDARDHHGRSARWVAANTDTPHRPGLLDRP